MDAKVTTATEVEIFGSVYHVRGDKDPEYLQSLAELVDRRMREIAQQVSTIDTAKIAILAALNLTDELFQSRKHKDGEQDGVQDKVIELAGQLGEVLQG